MKMKKSTQYFSYQCNKTTTDKYNHDVLHAVHEQTFALALSSVVVPAVDTRRTSCRVVANQTVEHAV